jgi:hypothetical protein
VDKNSMLYSPSGSVMGAVSSLCAVRSATGSLTGAITAGRTVVDTELKHVENAVCRGKEVWSGNGALVGVVQGVAPPLLVLRVEKPPAGDARDGDAAQEAGQQHAAVAATVEWSTLKVVADGGGDIGWWDTQRACVVDDGGSEVAWPTVSATEEPCSELPQAVDKHGAFLGYVLTSKAVVDARGRQVGVVMPDGVVFDSQQTPVGEFNLGSMTPNRNVLGPNGKLLGLLQLDGRVVSLEDGATSGLVTPSGRILNDLGQFVGVALQLFMDGHTVGADGVVYNADGTAIDRVQKDGTVVMGDPSELDRVLRPTTQLLCLSAALLECCAVHMGALQAALLECCGSTAL